MFSGIVEVIGNVEEIGEEGSNRIFKIRCSLANEFYIDQSISHNGVCLTITKIESPFYYVTAIQETLEKSNLNHIQKGVEINLERAMKYNGRLDGHIVQGHVDDIATCTKIEDVDGSWYFHFEFNPKHRNLLVEKGSICINGVSLTLINPGENTFSVAIIPYTFEHTNFKNLKSGDTVNLEFDILGKYVGRYMEVFKENK